VENTASGADDLVSVVSVGSSSCCYDNGAVGGVADGGAASSSVWCPAVVSSDIACRPELLQPWSSHHDCEDLAELFSRIGLGKYTDIFQQQEVSHHQIRTFRLLCIRYQMPYLCIRYSLFEAVSTFSLVSLFNCNMLYKGTI